MDETAMRKYIKQNLRIVIDEICPDEAENGRKIRVSLQLEGEEIDYEVFWIE